jgi:predicted TIM-barrel fold metal-dependent hydrolase
MSQPERLLIVSADGHSGAPAEEFIDYFDPALREEAAAALEEEAKFMAVQAEAQGGSTSMGGAMGFSESYEGNADQTSDAALAALDSPRRSASMNPAGRLAELDSQGVAAELLVPGDQSGTLPLFSVINQPHRAELRDAGARAYHRWLADFMSQADGRFYGMIDPGPCLDMDRTVEELHWAAAHGHICVSVPGVIEDETLPPIYSDYYEPFWRACADLDLALITHAGWGFAQGKMQEFIAKFLVTHLGAEATANLFADGMALDEDGRNALLQEFADSPTSPLRLDFGPRRLLWQLMLGGVFDRYPSLKFVLTEVRADWLPATLATLDEWFASQDTPLRRSPSEYWAANGYVTASSIHRSETVERNQIGLDKLMFGMDYPHPESTWPDTFNWIRAAFQGVPENEARDILGENAIRCFGLDRDKLVAVAERIGPLPSEVLGPEHSVKPQLLESFHKRAGYARPTEDVDIEAIRTLVDEDATALLAAR